MEENNIISSDIRGYKIITLCGSTKFKSDFEYWNKAFTSNGHVVLSVAFFKHTDAIYITEKEEKMLNIVHRRKIELSDEIFVINKGGYIGESTKAEIEYAKERGKIIRYMELTEVQSISNDFITPRYGMMPPRSKHSIREGWDGEK